MFGLRYQFNPKMICFTDTMRISCLVVYKAWHLPRYTGAEHDKTLLITRHSQHHLSGCLIDGYGPTPAVFHPLKNQHPAHAHLALDFGPKLVPICPGTRNLFLFEINVKKSDES